MTLTHLNAETSVLAERALVVDLEPIGLRSSLLRVAGSLDYDTVPAVRNAVEGQLRAGRSVFRVDLSEVDFIDCAGLRVMVELHNAALGEHGIAVIESASRCVRRLIDLTHLDEALHIVTEPLRAHLTVVSS